jgi:hypothetical protein
MNLRFTPKYEKIPLRVPGIAIPGLLTFLLQLPITFFSEQRSRRRRKIRNRRNMRGGLHGLRDYMDSVRRHHEAQGPLRGR